MSTQTQLISYPLNDYRYWLKVGAFAVLYFVAARVGFLLPFDGEIATLIWFATGVSLAALLLVGLEIWPAISLGALFVAISNQHSLPLTLGVVVAHTLEPFLGAYILRRYTSFDTKLENFSDVYYLLIFCIVISPAVGATFAVVSFAISPEGVASNLLNMWWHWWIAHAISLSVIVPLLLTWFSNTPHVKINKRFVEFMLVLGLLIVVSMLVFIRVDFLPIGNYPLGHVVFPFLLWIALRYSPREVAMAGFLTVSFAVVGTVQRTGPFSRPNLNLNLFFLGTFVFSVVLVVLMLSSIFTQRLRARQALQSSHDELEQRVTERTIELNNANSKLRDEVEERKKIADELRVARDNAVVALDYKNQILANVSHDARTPLNIIMLNTELLRMQGEQLTERQIRRLSTIDVSCQDLLHFINNLLDAANIQSNQVVPEMEAINVKEFFDKHLSKFQELARYKNLDFVVKFDETLPDEVTTDAIWLNKIVSNLITNAIKFTKEGSITISVAGASEGRWQFSVRDTGIGIPQDAVENIFQPFWQVDGSSTRQANRGVGLGLSIVKRFVTLMDGSVKIDSVEGQGATLTVEFPIVVSEKQNAEVG